MYCAQIQPISESKSRVKSAWKLVQLLGRSVDGEGIRNSDFASLSYTELNVELVSDCGNRIDWRKRGIRFGFGLVWADSFLHVVVAVVDLMVYQIKS